LSVGTQRNVVSGPMSIEMSIPVNPTNTSLLKFVRARVVAKGQNNVCVNLGSLSAVMSKW